MRLPDRFWRGVLLAPAIFVLHFLEEGPSFVAWFNDHVSPGITPGLFWSVNLAALVITVLLAAVAWSSRGAAALLAAIAWLSFLMLTNGAFHVTGAVVDGGYVPGLITAVVLYIPYCVWLGVHVVRAAAIPPVAAGLAALLGGLPMAIHGYRILFLGSRLF